MTTSPDPDNRFVLRQELAQLQQKFNRACEEYYSTFTAQDYDRWYAICYILHTKTPKSPAYTGIMAGQREFPT